MAGSIKGIIVEIGGDTSALQKSLSKVNSVTSSLSKELRGVNSLLKLDFKNTELLNQKQNILNESIESTQEKLKQLQNIKDQADKKISEGTKVSEENYRALQREIINTQNKLNNLKNEASNWTTAGRKIEEVGNKIENVGNKIDSVGNKLTLGVTAPWSALAIAGVKFASEQESSIQQVEKIYGNASNIIKEFLDNTAMAYNMSSKNAYKYAQIYGNLIQSITDDEYENATYTQELLKASSVIASATGRTMEDVMDRIRSGLLGNTEAIEDLGVNVNVALLETTDAFREFAGDKSWNQLDFKTQQQIRLFGILEQTTKKYGDEVNQNTTTKVQKLTAKFENMESKLSKNLLPVANILLDKADKYIDKLENIDDKTAENIITIGLLVAGIGPATKIVGTLTKTIATTAKEIGTFSQAIGVATNKTTSNKDSVNDLAKAMKSLVSPTGLAIAGVTAYAIAIEVATKKAREEGKEIQELNESLNNSIEARMSATNTINDNMNANLSEISNVQRLRDELSTLVDENSKVKEGYETRANFILNQLNSALGTEYSLNRNIIDGYNELSASIDDLIAKKKAQIVIEADEEKYKEAIQNKTDAYKTYLETQDKIAEVESRLAEIRENSKAGISISNFAEYEELKKQLEGLNTTLQNSENEFNSYNDTISRYEKNSELMLQGGAENYKKIYESITQTERNMTNIQSTEISKRLENAQNNLNEKTQLYDLEAQKNRETKDNIYSTNLEESKKKLQLVIDDLVAMTSTTEELSPEVEQAWKDLAKNSRDSYNQAISKLPSDIQEKITSTANVISNDKRITNEAGILALNVVDKFNRKQDAEQAGKNLVEGVNRGLNDQTAQARAKNSASAFSGAILGIFHKIWDEHSPSKATEESSINLLKGITIGIKKQAHSVIKDVSKFSNSVLNALNLDTDISKIPNMQKSLSQEINNSIKPAFFAPNITINTAHLDTQELDRIVTYVDKKFGGKL